MPHVSGGSSPFCGLNLPLCYQHLTYIYGPVDLKSNWKDIQELPHIACNLRLCSLFLEFSLRHFEESSDGELLVASKYDLVTGISVEIS